MLEIEKNRLHLLHDTNIQHAAHADLVYYIISVPVKVLIRPDSKAYYRISFSRITQLRLNAG